MNKTTGFHWLSLGGVGEIGKNCYVLEIGEKLLIIDVGMSFPDLGMFGVDIVIPDFSYLVKNQHRIAAIVLTHGHEDHIGSLSYLLQDLKKAPPVYGTRFTLALVRNKLTEFGLQDTVLHEFKPGDDFMAGGIRVLSFRVTHSIPDTVSLAVDTGNGLYLHSGDFKLDPEPIDGKLTDLRKLEAIGREGVLAMAVDTTNIESPGRSGSESSVRPALRDIVAGHNGRVFITCFASNLHRVQTAIDVAVELKRNVLVLGRTMMQNTQLGQDLGYLKVPHGVLVSPQEAERIKPSRLLVVLTGSQGEPSAAMARLAGGEHRWVSVQQDDLFIFSARAIPGNEVAIFSVIDDLFRLGAEVIYGMNTGVHVSGHASQEEIREYVMLSRPGIVIPHHGMFRHQMRCKKLLGQWLPELGPKQVPIVSIGERWHVGPEGCALVETVKAGEVYIAGDGRSDISRKAINERLALAEDGMVVFSVVLSEDGSSILAGPEVMAKGFMADKDYPQLYKGICAAIADAIGRNKQRAPDYRLQLRNNVQNAVQRVIFHETKINPIVMGMLNYAGDGPRSGDSDS
jgi:ribonuclease J